MQNQPDTGLIPRDRLNDEGREAFPRSLRGKLRKQNEYRKHKYGAIADQRDVASELVADLDRAIFAQQYRRMWWLAFVSALAALASATVAVVVAAVKLTAA